MKTHLPLIAAALLFAQLPAFSPAQTVTRVATLPSTDVPEGIAIDAAGNAFLSVGPLVKRVTPAGVVSTFATLPAGSSGMLGMKFDAAGVLHAAGGGSGVIWRFSATGEPSPWTTISGLTGLGLNDLALDRSGNAYVTDSNGYAVYKVTPAGTAQKWSESPLLRVRTAPTLFPGATLGPNGIAVGANGDVYVAITQPGRIVRIPVNPDGSAGTAVVWIEDELLASVDGIAFDTNGDLYAGLNIQNRIVAIKPDGKITTIAAGGELSTTTTIAFGRGGSERSLFVCNNGHFFPGAEASKTGLLRIDIGTLADSATPPGDNFAARGRVGTGADVLVAGFTVGGPRSKTVLIRGVGPALTALGVTGALADPKLDVYSSSGAVIDSNDNWGGTVSLGALATSRGGFPLASDSRDAALLLTLRPGTYTAQVSGVGGATGIALLEIYELP